MPVRVEDVGKSFDPHFSHGEHAHCEANSSFLVDGGVQSACGFIGDGDGFASAQFDNVTERSRCRLLTSVPP